MVWEPSSCLAAQHVHLFLQGDDSLSAITFDSDTETVSVIGGQQLVLLRLTFCLTRVAPRCAVGCSPATLF